MEGESPNPAPYPAHLYKEHQEHFDSVPAAVRAKHNSPEGATNNVDMWGAAEAVLAMVQTIRDLLPIEGTQTGPNDCSAMEAAHDQAANDYTVFERIRNPLGYPWPASGPSQFVVSTRAQTYYENLCSAMRSVCEHYGWQGLSKLLWIDGRPEEAQRPHCQVRNGIPIPAIAPALLDQVEKTASGLLAEVKATIPPPPAVPPMWEGGPPDVPFNTVGDLLRWIEEMSESLPYFRDSAGMYVEGAALASAKQILRNARRVLDSLNEVDFPQRPDAELRTIHDAEAAIADLRRWIRARLQSTGRADKEGDAFMGNGLAPDETNGRHRHDGAHGKAKPKRGRRKAAYETVQREAELAADWKRASKARVYKGDFARDNGTNVQDLDRLLDRVRARNRASGE